MLDFLPSDLQSVSVIALPKLSLPPRVKDVSLFEPFHSASFQSASLLDEKRNCNSFATNRRKAISCSRW
jgi:hypothetical protein